MAAISFNIAVIHAKKIIELSMKENAKNGRLNYVMRFYLRSLKLVILVTVQFAFCHCRLTRTNTQCKHAAVHGSVTGVHTPMRYASLKRIFNVHAHSAGTLYQETKKKSTR